MPLKYATEYDVYNVHGYTYNITFVRGTKSVSRVCADGGAPRTIVSTPNTIIIIVANDVQQVCEYYMYRRILSESQRHDIVITHDTYDNNITQLNCKVFIGPCSTSDVKYAILAKTVEKSEVNKSL